ncbi:MAG: SDR family NAD(P)-dependent oxidoreductase [Hyphomicrobiaceae bacterium]|nr:SDR family NAD(P)-dependent oxidoreductase [Hyphomicrobiaceae bacterium]
MPKVAVVTGAGSGIGRAVALALQGDGYDVALAGRRLAELEKTAAAAKPGGGRMMPVAADIGDEASVKALFAATKRAFGRLDVLFNNAGIFAPAMPIEELPVDTWRKVVDINLTGAFLCCQEAIRMMKTQDPRGGRIINNGSISAYVPRPRTAAYAATKHAIAGLTKAIALEGRGHRIACSQIDIGNAATALAAAAASTAPAAVGAAPEPSIELKHVADAVLYMARLPLEANVLFMTLKATEMPFEGRG